MANIISTIALSPLLLMQGLLVRSRIPRLPESSGDRSGVSGTGESLSLLIVGDSAAAGVGAESQDQALLGRTREQLEPHYNLTWRLFAQSGATTASTLETLESLDDHQYDVAVTSLGVNDVKSFLSADTWLQQQRAVRERLRERHGVKHLIVSDLPPMGLFPSLPQPLRWHLGSRAQQFSRLLAAELEEEDDCDFLAMQVRPDPELMASDGFHPGPKFYVEWAQHVGDSVRRRW